MNPWSDLPNAKYIDQVLADLKSHPEEFRAARDAALDAARRRTARRSPSRRRSPRAALDAARDAALDAALDAARDAALDAAWRAALDAARGAAWRAAWRAVAALIAWDHSSRYLAMTYEELQVWSQLNEDPAAVLLLPYLKARELIVQKSTNLTINPI